MKIKCCRESATIREEAWQDQAGKIVRYNLAFIHHILCQKDNGRVLGYDSAHGHHHRHFMGSVEAFEFASYEELSSKFFGEVAEICRNK